MNQHHYNGGVCVDSSCLHSSQCQVVTSLSRCSISASFSAFFLAPTPQPVLQVKIEPGAVASVLSGVQQAHNSVLRRQCSCMTSTRKAVNDPYTACTLCSTTKGGVLTACMMLIASC